MRLKSFRAKSQSARIRKSEPVGDEADEIPPDSSSSSSSMNVDRDIAQLSYKELQTLAVKYRVPGNIKKTVLVKVLQAAQNGNNAELHQLLQDLKKNRKRKTKSKDSKLGVTSTPLHSPDYITTDDNYFCQQQELQQQSPYQWIGAEEEIMSKEDDTKIPHYEEFKQLLLKRIQQELQVCNDNNNNQARDLNIVDLRTTPMTPNLQMSPPVEPSYSKVSSISDTDPLAISLNDRSSYQVPKEPEGGPQGSFLLKRMLQAPVGANLGEIASSLLWATNLLDNSDTLTAESESNENEAELDVNTNEYYNLLKNSQRELLINEANLVPQQVSSVLASDNQYRFSGNIENWQSSYQNWAISNMVEMPDNGLQSSTVFRALYYNNNNTDPTVTIANADNNMAYQYQTDTAYNDGQNYNFDAQNVYYATGTDMMANNSSDIYYLQNFGKHSGETDTRYFRNVDTFGQNSMQQNVYANADNRMTNDQQYYYPRFTQETSNLLNETFEQSQNNVAGLENNINQETDTGNLQESANGTVETFWPKWTSEPNNLENILNYHMSKQVDYSKLNQTSCVYCYVAPIVSQRSNLTINGNCSIKRRYTAEQRRHSFSPYWMLYNDTSQGMRMTNMPNNSFEQPMSTHTTIITSNDNLKQITNNDVWMNQYEPMSITDDMNIQVSDSRSFTTLSPIESTFRI